MTTGEKLQNLRKQNNYTQEELASIMGVSRQSISKWESDIVFPETEKIITLSKLYHCSIDYLLNEENDNPEINQVSKPNEATNKVYNKKRLPLIIATITTCILSLFLFIPQWFDGVYYFSGMQVKIYASFYNVMQTKGDPFANAQALCVLSYIILYLIISVLFASIIYIFIDHKAFRISIRLANVTIFGFLTIFMILTLTANATIGWTLVAGIEYALIALLAVLQYAVKPIRVVK